MSKNTQTVQTVGASNISFWGLLTLVFVTLKLCGVIDWSWWVVLLPSFVSIACLLLCLAFAAVCLGIAVFLKWRISKLK